MRQDHYFKMNTELSPIQQLAALLAEKEGKTSASTSTTETTVAEMIANLPAKTEEPAKVAEMGVKDLETSAPIVEFKVETAPEFLALQSQLSEKTAEFETKLADFNAKTADFEAKTAELNAKIGALEGTLAALNTEKSTFLSKIQSMEAELTTLKIGAPSKGVSTLVVADSVAANGPTVTLVEQYKAIKDPKEAARFYREHKSEILSSYGKS